MEPIHDDGSQNKPPRGDPECWLDVVDRYSQPQDEDINESLVRALEARDESDRNAAVNALVALNDLYAAGRIFWVLFNGSTHARRAAAGVLCKIGDPVSIPYLNKALGDRDRTVRETLIEALKRLGSCIHK